MACHRLHGRLAAAILLLASWIARGPPDPLSRLDGRVRAGLARDLKTYADAPEGKRGAIRARLEEAYGILHDLRNREAFADLWQGDGKA